ncbi:MAG: ATP-binding cassette domain-containing protein [Actinobacteria bacterium]|nr:ATP-binding cassette domain-containing protein [Actinomycetota bacterium]
MKSFDGRVVVDVDDLILGSNPVEGLIGPNGAGKTTLMRMIMHSVRLDQGTVTFHPGGGSSSVVISSLPAHAMASLGVVKTNQVIQDFEKLTIWDSLLLAAARGRDERPFRIFAEKRVWAQNTAEIKRYLDEFPFASPYGFAKSAGEKKLLDILRCLLLRPKILLLDEPTAGLPADVRDRVMALVRQKAVDEYVSVVIVEHDLNVIWALSDYVHFMAEGSVVLQGDPAWIREHETVVEKYLGKGHVGR